MRSSAARAAHRDARPLPHLFQANYSCGVCARTPWRMTRYLVVQTRRSRAPGTGGTGPKQMWERPCVAMRRAGGARYPPHHNHQTLHPRPPSPSNHTPHRRPAPSLAPPPNTTKLVASVGFAPKGLKQTRRIACRRPKKSLTDRSEKGEKRYTLQIFICVQSSRPDHCGTSVNGPGHGSAYQSCVAVALLVINTGADFSTNKNIKTVEP